MHEIAKKAAPQEVQQQQVASTLQADAFRIINTSSGIWPPIFDGSFGQGEEIQQRVMVFERQMTANFRKRGCLEAVERTVPIKVGLKESSQEA